MKYRYYKIIDKDLVADNPIKRTNGKIVQFYYERFKDWRLSTYSVNDLKYKNRFVKISEADAMLELI